MPRKRELTWQAGSGDRPGRWRKKYKGQVFYVGTGSSKSDHASYQKALTNWQEEKKRVDARLAGQPKPHQAEYEEAIGDWEKVLRWSQNHGDQATAELAKSKLAELISRLDQKSPPPVEYGDRFWDTFEIPAQMREEIASVTEARAASLGLSTAAQTGERPNPSKQITPDGPIHSPAMVRRELWQDRLGQEETSVEEQPRTLSDFVEDYLRKERLRVDAGRLSAGRFSAKRNNVHRFIDWAGEGTHIDAITSNLIQNFHSELLSQVTSEKIASDTAHGRLGDTASFIRWLWQIEALAELPRILERKSNELSIGMRMATPETFTIQEIQTLLAASNDRLKLYLMLMLNCGMYLGDVSELRQDEVSHDRSRRSLQALASLF